jgi:hypothetical protein
LILGGLPNSHGRLAAQKKDFLSEGVMLAVIPAVVYFLAYEYELGYFKAFEAPEDLVSVDLTSILTFSIAAFGLYSILYQVFNSLWYSHLNITELSWKHLFFKKALPLFFLLFFLFYLLYPFSWLRTVISPALLILTFIIFIKENVYSKWFTTFIFIATLSISICQGIGQYSAANKITFTVVKDKNIFVIRKIGDYLLCTTYEAKSKTFSKTFQTIPLKEDLYLEYKNIGPLHLQP